MFGLVHDLEKPVVAVDGRDDLMTPAGERCWRASSADVNDDDHPETVGEDARAGLHAQARLRLFHSPGGGGSDMAEEQDVRRRCVGCRRTAPEVETDYTLISGRFGWRLSRRLARDGTLFMEWRCPDCWQRFKEERALAMTPSEGVPMFRDDDKPPSSRKR
jgi:hypothetical protein